MLSPYLKSTLFSLIMFSLIPGAQAADLFVSPAGVDNPSCSAAAPCRQIRQAVDLAGSGTTINVADGEYLGFDVRSKTGTAADPLVIRAQGSNALVLPTSDRSDNRDNIFVSLSDWIVIDGLQTYEAPRAGMRIDQSHNVNVKNSTFGNNGQWGIFTNHSNDLVLEHNEAFGSIDEHGIYVSNSGDRPTIRGNKVYNNNESGIQINADLSSGSGRDVVGDGIVTGALIEQNTIYGNGQSGGGAINLDGVQDSIVRNNLLYDNHASGIALFMQDGAQGASNVQVLNNTLDMATDGRWLLRVVESSGPIISRNNIFYNRNTNRGAISLAMESSNPLDNPDLNNLDSDFNIFDGLSFAATTNDAINRYDLNEWQTVFGQDENSFIEDPSLLFLNLSDRDYRLVTGSAAVDEGIVLASVTNDIVGTSRPQGPAYDIGAFELSRSVDPGPGPIPVIPEPASLLLLGSGLVGFAFRGKTKK